MIRGHEKNLPHSILCVHSLCSAAFVSFGEPSYVFSESSGTGQVEIVKVGNFTDPIFLNVIAGKSSSERKRKIAWD